MRPIALLLLTVFGIARCDDGSLDPNADNDRDGVVNASDPFPLDPQEWADTDKDGVGDNEDTDDDDDGAFDGVDEYPLDPAEQVDSDSDGRGNNADTDDDNDELPDVNDAFPLDAEEQFDSDRDGFGDHSDIDTDGDHVLNADEVACGTDPINSGSLPTDTLPRQIDEYAYRMTEGEAEFVIGQIVRYGYAADGQVNRVDVGYDGHGDGVADRRGSVTTIKFREGRPELINYTYYTAEGGVRGERVDVIAYDDLGRIKTIHAESDLINDGHYASVVTTYTYDEANRVVREVQSGDRDVDGRNDYRVTVERTFAPSDEILTERTTRDDGLDGKPERIESLLRTIDADGFADSEFYDLDRDGDGVTDLQRLSFFARNASGQLAATATLEDLDSDGTMDTSLLKSYRYYRTCRP